MKKKLVICSLLTIISVAVVITLQDFAARNAHHPNGFRRRIPPANAVMQHELDLEFNSFYIAGLSGDSIFLGNTTSPLTVLVTDSLLSAPVTNHISGTGNLSSGKLNIDSGRFYLSDRKQRTVYTGSINGWQAQNKIYTRAFSDITLPIGTHTFIVRTFKDKRIEYELAKENTDDATIIHFPDILQKQGDGVFSNDGMLQYDPVYSRLVYIYFYRNEFIVMDTSLCVLSRYHTIDTNMHAKIEVSPVISDHSFVISKNPNPVNKRATVFDNRLYILSSLAGDNEPYTLLAQMNVIDVYNLQSGQYERSIYLPLYKGEKIKNLSMLRPGILLAIADHYLVSYRLPG